MYKPYELENFKWSMNHLQLVAIYGMTEAEATFFLRYTTELFYFGETEERAIAIANSDVAQDEYCETVTFTSSDVKRLVAKAIANPTRWRLRRRLLLKWH